MEWTQNTIQQELTRFLAVGWLDGEGRVLVRGSSVSSLYMIGETKCHCKPACLWAVKNPVILLQGLPTFV